MNLLLDTHAWVWSMFDVGRLTETAIFEIDRAEAIWISTVSLYEIAQKVRIGKWDAMAGYVPNLPLLMERQGAIPAVVSPQIGLLAGGMSWPHRDPFDRIIAATAIVGGYSLVSADGVFDTLPDGPSRIW